MELTARDIMFPEFITVSYSSPVSEAARLIFNGKVRETGYKPFGILVTNEIDQLVGMISINDILYHLRPPFMNYEVSCVTVWDGELEPYLDQFKELRVEHIMSAPVLTASPDDHLMVLIDHMVKNGVRRIPVIEGGRILGVVYQSDVFYRLCESWLTREAK